MQQKDRNISFYWLGDIKYTKGYNMATQLPPLEGLAIAYSDQMTERKPKEG